MQMKERNELVGIDIFNLIFAVFVMFIHCHPADDVSFLLANGVGRLAVLFCRLIKPFGTFLLGATLYFVGIFNEAYAGFCPAFLKKIFDIYNLVFERTRIGLFFWFLLCGNGFSSFGKRAVPKEKADGFVCFQRGTVYCADLHRELLAIQKRHFLF